MNHLLYNISIVLIIIGIILLTNSLSTNTPTYDNKNNNNNNINLNKTDIIQDFPSKVFNKMFDSPSVWMGYTDTESNEVILSK